MPAASRREFLTDLGRGSLLAALGPAWGSALGLAPAAAWADERPALHFGDLEPLVTFLQETPVPRLQEALAAKLKQVLPLPRLLAAGALANARSFGGEDYIGFHTLMAMMPAWRMAKALPPAQQALPVFKVLYRNTARIQEHGGRAAEVLQPLPAVPAAARADELRAALRRRDANAAEGLFAALLRQDVQQGFESLLDCVDEDTEVHRTVLPYRAWELLEIVGQEHAHTLLRQSLRYCLDAEARRRPEWELHGQVLSRLLEEHRLLERGPGTRRAEDAWIESLSRTVFEGGPEQAAGAVAAAMAEGFAAADVGEAIALAANQLVLRDHGRPPAWESAGKPAGSVHGDSIGVHASDAVHAWRNLAGISTGRNRFACLILGAWQVARDRASPGCEFLRWEAMPSKRQVALVTGLEAGPLLEQLDVQIRANLQGHAAGVVQRWGELGLPAGPVFDLLRGYAISEDGALHAEKYFQTVWDEFHRSRPAFRWRHLAALARVTASEYGRPAPGQAEARELLGV